MRARTNKKPHGQIRQGQVVTTFGPGSLLDLPNHSIVVGGLDHWTKGGVEIHETRLLEKLKRLLDLPDLRLFSPPSDIQDPGSPQTGITAWQFPEWFITQDVEQDSHQSTTRSRLLVHRKALTRGKYEKRHVVPVRFVRACRKGHIGDIDWYAFVHRGQAPCRSQLWIDERGTSGDLSEVWIRCGCGQERAMNEAALMETRSLGNCDGSRPWLGPYTKETCGEPNRLLVRTASNAYFPQLMSVISLPEKDQDLQKAVSHLWEAYLQHVVSLESLQLMLSAMPPVRETLKGFEEDSVLRAILARKGIGGPPPTVSVKQAEIETLLSGTDEIGSDKFEGTFYARILPKEEWAHKPWMSAVERIVLVHRLREVVAQVGFTRFEAQAPDIEGELEMGVTRAALGREISWLPATENRGEGIFLSFRKDAIEQWLERPSVKDRGKKLIAGFEAWKKDHPWSHREFPGLPYFMLHTLSHLLLTNISLECGYPLSSLRERIYSGQSGHGVLVFTGSQDAEGTLGGLVESGRIAANHLQSALNYGRLCSNDPVCAQHTPSDQFERRFLHGAACHGCLLISETSCEQFNDFLDRALVVSTVEGLGTEFFEDNQQC